MSRFLKQRRHAWEYEGGFLMQHQRSRRLNTNLSWRINWNVKENSFVIFLSWGCFHTVFHSFQRTDSFTKAPVILNSIRSKEFLLTVLLKKSCIEPSVSVRLCMDSFSHCCWVVFSVSRLPPILVKWWRTGAVGWTTMVLIKIGSDRENGKRERAERR